MVQKRGISEQNGTKYNEKENIEKIFWENYETST